MTQYEENKKTKNSHAWAVIISMSVLLITWFMLNMFLIGEQPRTWDYAIVEDTPAKSIYSTNEVNDDEKAIKQIETIPGADSVNEASYTNDRNEK